MEEKKTTGKQDEKYRKLIKVEGIKDGGAFERRKERRMEKKKKEKIGGTEGRKSEENDE